LKASVDDGHCCIKTVGTCVAWLARRGLAKSHSFVWSIFSSTTLATMATDWSFSFAFADDGEDSGDERVHDASKSANASRMEAQQPLSEDSRLARELDISTRDDPAVFNKNPWSIAKLNAASRPNHTRSKQMISPPRKAQPQKSSQTYPEDKTPMLMAKPLSSSKLRAKPPVEIKQSSKVINNASKTKPVVSSIKVKRQPQEQTLPVLQPKNEGILFLFLLDILCTPLNSYTCPRVNRHQCYVEITSS
jgi:hypothetical protein